MVSKLRPSRILPKIFPILNWGRGYSTEIALADIVAGITIALTLIPQSIAYASLAGLDAQYGLYSSFMGSFIYILFGTTPEINIGPTALLSLLTFTYTHNTHPDFAIMLCFLGGIIQLCVGFARLGFLVDFVSLPVVSGFTSAASLIIACAQVKGLLGLSFKAETFLETWKAVIENINSVRLGDAVLSVVCCVILLSMRKLKDLKIKPKKGEELTEKEKTLERCIWFISVGRNATVVILCTVASYFLTEVYQIHAIKLTGNIVSGLPTFQVPHFNTTLRKVTEATGADIASNVTVITKAVSFTEMVSHIGSGIIVVPLIGIIANVAIAKAFSKGSILDANQEIVALGLCNFVSAFAQSMPCNGSFSRSAVSNASGVKTPLAGLYTGVIVLMTLGFLTPYFFFIPKSALASVIICAVIFMIDVEIVPKLWRNSKQDLIPLFGTFIACLFIGVEFGILIGVLIDVVILMYYNSRPNLSIRTVPLSSESQYTVVTPSGGLFFASANYVRNIITKQGTKESPVKNVALVIDCSYFHRSDWTSLQGIKSILGDYKKLNQKIIFLNCSPVFKKKIFNEINYPCLFCSSEEEVRSTLQAYVNIDGTTAISINDYSNAYRSGITNDGFEATPI